MRARLPNYSWNWQSSLPVESFTIQRAESLVEIHDDENAGSERVMLRIACGECAGPTSDLANRLSTENSGQLPEHLPSCSGRRGGDEQSSGESKGQADVLVGFRNLTRA